MPDIKVIKIKDGEQIYPQTSTEAVIGLTDKITALETALAEKETKITELTEKVAKQSAWEDRLALTMYPEYPHITFATGENVVGEVTVLRGNETVTDTVWCNGNKTIAIASDGSGYVNNGAGQFNASFIVSADNYAPVITLSEDSAGKYNKYEVGLIAGSTANYRLKITKLTGDISVTVSAAEAWKVQYVSTEGSYSFSEESVDVPALVAKGTDLTFSFYQNIDKSKGTAPAASAAIAKVKSITIGGTELTLNETLISDSGKTKCTVTIPAASVTGDVVVTLN